MRRVGDRNSGNAARKRPKLVLSAHCSSSLVACNTRKCILTAASCCQAGGAGWHHRLASFWLGSRTACLVQTSRPIKQPDLPLLCC